MAWNAELYTYRVRWSEEDGEFLATVAEFPSLSWLEDSMHEALSGLTSLVSEVVDDLEQSGEPVPEPLSIRSYSGNIRLRMPPEQHRGLAIQAAEEGVSLNRLICSLISRPAMKALVAPQRPAANSEDKMRPAAQAFGKTATYSVSPAKQSLSLIQSGKTVTSASGIENIHGFESKEWPEEM